MIDAGSARGFRASFRDGELHLGGDLDAAVAPQLRAAFTDLIARRAAQPTVDLSGVTFLDLACLSELIVLAKALLSTGVVVLRGPPAEVRRVLALTGTSVLFVLEPPA